MNRPASKLLKENAKGFQNTSCLRSELSFIWKFSFSNSAFFEWQLLWNRLAHLDRAAWHSVVLEVIQQLVVVSWVLERGHPIDLLDVSVPIEHMRSEWQLIA